MSKFTFTTPDGQTIEVEGPPGATLAQAQALFEQQVEAGSFVGITPGAIIDRATQAAAGLATAVGVSLPSTSLVPDLGTLPAIGTLDKVDFAKAIKAVAPVGELDTNQVTSMLAQTSKTVAQAASAITDKGLGSYGLTPQQLEQLGYLKAGTVEQFLGTTYTTQQISEVLSSPTVWSGKEGINAAADILGDAEKQSRLAQQTLNSSLAALKQQGLTTGSETASQLAALVNSTSQYGLDNVKQWIDGNAPADIVNGINNVAKQAEYAVNLVDQKLGADLLNSSTPRPAVNTVDRATVDAALGRIIGSAKIPKPRYQNLGSTVDSALSSGTPDNELIYTGNDEIVWDRINGERIRRGLPGLAAIGYPRPGSTPTYI